MNLNLKAAAINTVLDRPTLCGVMLRIPDSAMHVITYLLQ